MTTKTPNEGPPDLGQIFKNLYKFLLSILGFKNTNKNNFNFNQTSNQVKPPIGSDYPFNFQTKNIFVILLSLLLIVYLIVGFYIVRPAELAVIRRFGKFNRIAGPGPHWLFSFIEKQIIIDCQKVESSKHSASMLTKDENIVFVEIELQYRIANIKDYLFQVVDPVNTLKQAAESAMRQVVGNAKLDFIMTEGRAQISLDIEQQIMAILDQYQTGIELLTVAFKEAKAPEAVKGAFDDVIKAREEQERLKHAAEAFANKIVPEAKGDAERMLVEAQAYKQETISKATGDTLRFNAILTEYNKAPEITKKRIYIDALEELLTNSSKVIVDLKNTGNLVYLPLDRFMANSNKSAELSDSGGR